MINPMDLTGKRIIVTGASSGIGRETALHLSRLGARTALIARNVERLTETLEQLEGDGHAMYPFDLEAIEQIDALVRQIVAEGGKISGLAHCAGIATMCPLKQLTPEKLMSMMKVNTFSFVQLARALSDRRCLASPASFVGVSSVASVKGEKGKTAYCASKAAMDGAKVALAHELADRDIRVNSVMPGWVQTDMVAEFVQAFGETATALIERDQYLGVCQPVDVANAIAFLLSDASMRITGTSLVVDGGVLS